MVPLSSTSLSRTAHIFTKQDDVKFRCNFTDNELGLKVLNLEDICNLGSWGNEVGGTIKRVARRQAVRYMPEDLEAKIISLTMHGQFNLKARLKLKQSCTIPRKNGCCG